MLFGHWSLQQAISNFLASLAAVHSPHLTYNWVIAQLHQIFIIWPQGLQSPGWHGRIQLWLQPLGRGFKHSDSHLRQLLPLSSSFVAFLTLWQSLSHLWLEQGKILPHLRPQELGLAILQGQSAVSWFPKQVTGTGCLQSGQSRLFIWVKGPLFSHGVAAFLFSMILTSTWSWQGSGQICPQLIFCWHICLQPGQVPKWQACGVLDSWWQSGGILHFCRHFGGLVTFSIPHGTKILLARQKHETSCVRVHG